MVEIPWWGLLYIIFVVLVASITYIGDRDDDRVSKIVYIADICYIAITALYFQDITDQWLIYTTFAVSLMVVGHSVYSFVGDAADLIKTARGQQDDTEPDEEPLGLGMHLLGTSFVLVSFLPGAIMAILKSMQLWQTQGGF
jgi:hypothetical protein